MSIHATQAATRSEERAVPPIAPGPHAGEALWFLGFLVTVKCSAETTGGGVAVLEHLAARGAGSPLHVHRLEEEWFYVLEGELTLWVGGYVIDAPTGAFVYGPRGIAHTFIVRSERARFLLVTQPAGFEKFVRAIAEPAAERTMPPARTEPANMAALTAAAAAPASRSSDPRGC